MIKLQLTSWTVYDLKKGFVNTADCSDGWLSIKIKISSMIMIDNDDGVDRFIMMDWRREMERPAHRRLMAASKAIEWASRGEWVVYVKRHYRTKHTPTTPRTVATPIRKMLVDGGMLHHVPPKRDE